MEVISGQTESDAARDNILLLSLDRKTLPGRIPEDVEVFTIGDVHGQAELLAFCLSQIALSVKPVGYRRLVIFLGDLIDRGPDSPETVRLALASRAITGADDVVLLPGNHELALHAALCAGGDPQGWLVNGGKSVLDKLDGNWREKTWGECADLLLSVFPKSWVSGIADAPSHWRCGDLLFVHAGLHPFEDPQNFLKRDRVIDDEHWATIRHPFLGWDGGWDYDPPTGTFFKGSTVVVHGHTPALNKIARRIEDLGEMDGSDAYRAVCLDAGAAYRPQLGWARFWNDGATTAMVISACVAVSS